MLFRSRDRIEKTDNWKLESWRRSEIRLKKHECHHGINKKRDRWQIRILYHENMKTSYLLLFIAKARTCRRYSMAPKPELDETNHEVQRWLWFKLKSYEIIFLETMWGVMNYSQEGRNFEKKQKVQANYVLNVNWVVLCPEFSFVIVAQFMQYVRRTRKMKNAHFWRAHIIGIRESDIQNCRHTQLHHTTYLWVFP